MTLSWSPGWLAVAILTAAACLVLPLWCVSAPAMPDYPAHLASYFLIADGAHSPAVSKFYQIAWAFLPNLAGEVIVPTLRRWVGLETAAKLFISAGVVFWVLGPSLVHRALFGRLGAAPLLSALFAYNANFMWGFLNYYFAAGMLFIVFAAWVASDDRRGPAWLVGLAVAVTVIYFSHIFAAATLLLMILCFETGRLRQHPHRSPQNIAKHALQVISVFLPSAFAYLVLKPAGMGGGVEFNFIDSWQDRIEAAIEHSFDRPFFLLIAILCLFVAIGIWRKYFVFERRMIPVLIGLALATLLSPEWAMGGWGVDLRLPAVLGSMVFASAELRLNPKAMAALLTATLAVIAYNAVALTRNWQVTAHQFDEFRQVAHRLPAGSRLLTVLDGDAIGPQSDQPYWHMAELAIIDPGAFTPLLFTTKDQHIVQLRPEYREIAAASAQQGSPPDISELDDLAAGLVDGDTDIETVFPYLMRFQCNFDQALVIDLDGPRSRVPNMLKLRVAGSFFAIYDILPDASCDTK